MMDGFGAVDKIPQLRQLTVWSKCCVWYADIRCVHVYYIPTLHICILLRQGYEGTNTTSYKLPTVDLLSDCDAHVRADHIQERMSAVLVCAGNSHSINVCKCVIAPLFWW